MQLELKARKGIYVQGFIGEESIDFLVDTGASETFVSMATYHELAADDPPELYESDGQVVLADGKPLELMGPMNVAVSLGGMEMITPVTVVAIQVPAILGMDFLLRTRASLDMQGMKLTCGGRTVPLRDENSSPLVGQIHVERTAVVPAGGEIVPSGKVEGWGEKPWTEIAMVEPGRALKIHRKGIMVARAVVKMESSVPVRVWNTGDEPVSIYAGTHLAEVTSMLNSEIEKTRPIAGVTRRIATGVKPGAAEAPVPEHLQDLWQRSKLHLAESESSSVARLLVEHQDQFPGMIWILGEQAWSNMALILEMQFQSDSPIGDCQGGNRRRLRDRWMRCWRRK